MARYELLGGIHYERDQKTRKETRFDFVKGKLTVVKSDDDLVAKFGATKFRLLEDGRGHDSPPPAPEPVAAPAPAQPETEDDDTEPQNQEEPLGKDVSAEFKGAAEAGLQVLQGDKGYYVAEGGKRLFGAVESKSEVRSFLKKHALSKEE